MNELLAGLGLFRGVDAKNYRVNCLIHSLRDKVSAEVLKECIRNDSIPRKHLSAIGREFNVQFKIHTYGDGAIRTFGSSAQDAVQAELCLLNNHYFPFIKNTGLTGFALKNYEELSKSYINWHRKKSLNNGSSEKLEKTISSMSLMKVVLSSKYVRRIDISNEEIYRTIHFSKVDETFSDLSFSDHAIQLVHAQRHTDEDKDEHRQDIANIKKYKRALQKVDGGDEAIERLDAQAKRLGMGYKETSDLLRANLLPDVTIFFDFESSSVETHTADEETHTAYLVAWKVYGEEEVHHAKGSECALEFLQWINDYYGSDDVDEKTDVTLIAHNVTYDISFLLEHLECGSMQAIKKGNKFISASGSFGDVKLMFKDSWKLIPAPLRDFPKMFNLPVEKEIMPYDIYTPEFLDTDMMIDPAEIELAYDKTFVDNMRPNIIKWDCEQDGKWDMMTYSLRYCELDIEVLSAGWDCFRNMVLEQFDIDPNGREIMTVAGMSYRHLSNEGCLEGCYGISGQVLSFIRKGTVGGQTQSAENKSMIVTAEIEDQDMRSLYPFAMVEMKGIPKGPPKVFTGQIPANADHFYVQIKVQTVKGCDFHFPIIALRNEQEGTNEWTNDIEGKTIIVGKQTLEDLIYWNEVFEYEVVHGYYLH